MSLAHKRHGLQEPIDWVQRSSLIPQTRTGTTQEDDTVQGRSKLINYLSPSSPSRTQEIGAIALLPFDISFEDKHLLHTYALAVSTAVYGTSQTPYFSSIRDLVFPTCYFAPLVLQWPLIEAEAHVRRRRHQTTTTTTNTFTTQRAIAAYQAMNRYRNTCNGNVTDELLSGIIMAIVAEFRLNGAALARVHMRGY
ncbi:hypothetical protein ASPCAL14265 [Aspergillus calidoustus]|uniref:Uncharacterized protein n=1 Tax=Aspergillus calidoustus TaxID=454130 RepID=A0A0U5GJQ3_ASPCI|nr:hypothetical protein ASPCAL14265 [Aspergillus calidoustus]